ENAPVHDDDERRNPDQANCPYFFQRRGGDTDRVVHIAEKITHEVYGDQLGRDTQSEKQHQNMKRNDDRHPVSPSGKRAIVAFACECRSGATAELLPTRALPGLYFHSQAGQSLPVGSTSWRYWSSVPTKKRAKGVEVDSSTMVSTCQTIPPLQTPAFESGVRRSPE